MSSRYTETILKQGDIEETHVDMLTDRSDIFFTKGLRGLAVLVPPAWTAADIGFVAIHGPVAQPIRDSLGSLVVITGIVTDASFVYVAPSSIWVLGAANKARLISINTDGTGSYVTQGAVRGLKVFRLY